MSLPSIVLIGPSKAGKTTLARALGEATGWPWLDLDKLRWDYYAEIGYDPALADAHRRHGGIVELAQYWRPFDVYGVERVLHDFPAGHVIAFGAGHSYYDAPGRRRRISWYPPRNSNVVCANPSRIWRKYQSAGSWR